MPGHFNACNAQLIAYHRYVQSDFQGFTHHLHLQWYPTGHLAGQISPDQCLIAYVHVSHLFAKIDPFQRKCKMLRQRRR